MGLHEREHLGCKPGSRAGRETDEYDSSGRAPGGEYELTEVLALGEKHAALGKSALDHGEVAALVGDEAHQPPDWPTDTFSSWASAFAA